jgi:hypothetical protein
VPPPTGMPRTTWPPSTPQPDIGSSRT